MVDWIGWSSLLVLFTLVLGVCAGAFYAAYLAYLTRKRREAAPADPARPLAPDALPELRALNDQMVRELAQAREALDRARSTLERGIKG